MKKATFYLSTIVLIFGIALFAVDTIKASSSSSSSNLAPGCIVITSDIKGYMGAPDFACEEYKFNEATWQWEWMLLEPYFTYEYDCYPASPSDNCYYGYCNMSQTCTTYFPPD